jgi:TolB-like protein
LNKNRFRQFYRELRHRKVIRFALAYAILAWLIIEISSVIFPAFLFPEWTVRLVIILLTLGFIPALVLAWIFDFTLQGIERTGSETLSPSEVTLGENTHAHPPQIEDAVASVAVLPFDNLGNVDDNRVFAEGIATEIHGKICQLHRLRVAPRRSSFRFSDRDEPLNEIAQSLNVRYILSGSVLAVGARIQITAELDDRSEISSALAKPTDSLDAWSLVQRARAYIVDYNAGSFSSAEDALQQAIELDPDYSAARAALGSVLAEKVLNGFSSDAKADSDLAIEMIESAATQSPNDPFVLKMSGMVWSSLGDPNRAIRALRLSVGIAPYDFGAWGFLGWPLVATGKAEDLEELHSVLSRILAMAPEHPGAAYWLHHRGAAFLCDDDLDAARQFVEQSIDKHRGLSWAWLTYANILGSLGEHRKAREAADEATRLNANMTVPHYASRLEVMTADGTTLQRRTAGLRAAELLD